MKIDKRKALTACEDSLKLFSYAAEKRSLRKHTFAFEIAAGRYLKDKFWMWYHAMKRLTPEIFNDWIALEDVEFLSFEAVIDLIRMNATLALHEYVPVFIYVSSAWRKNTRLEHKEIALLVSRNCNRSESRIHL